MALSAWLSSWLMGYVDGSPHTSAESFKAGHPLAAARVVLEDQPDAPGRYDARIFITPHYQPEGISVALRLISQVSVG